MFESCILLPEKANRKCDAQGMKVIEAFKSVDISAELISYDEPEIVGVCVLCCAKKA